MKGKWELPEAARLKELLDRYKYVLIVIAAGLLLLLWPSGEETRPPEDGGGLAGAQAAFDLEELERKLSDTLSQVDGAGRVSVALTLKSGMEQVLAADRSSSGAERGGMEEKTVILDTDSGEEAVLISQRYPVFQGALVVAQGGDDAKVRLLLTQAVSALTGLGADHITVCRGG